jgi:hypothetical protein
MELSIVRHIKEKGLADAIREFKLKTRVYENVSKTLTGSGHGDVTKNCPTCKKDFTMPFKRRHRIFCSSRCSNNNPEIKKKIGQAVSDVKNGRVKIKHEFENNTRKERLKKWNEENGISNS